MLRRTFLTTLAAAAALLSTQAFAEDKAKIVGIDWATYNPLSIVLKEKGFLEADLAKDGIQVKVKARVTVRTNLDRFVGGATEETIIARVGEGIVTTIGSSTTYKEVLENPDRISKTVLEKGLDSGTAFEILSIDIADIDVGENIGARLQADQAEADTRVARAKAEQRRAEAIASEQEMKAKVAENRSRLVLAEAALGFIQLIGKQGFVDLAAQAS